MNTERGKIIKNIRKWRTTKKIGISTLNVTVRVLMLDTKRFTKSIFNQLPGYVLKDRSSLPEETATVKIVGYVALGGGANFTVLVNFNGELVRFESERHFSPYEDYMGNIWILRDSLDQIFISC